MLLLLLLFSCHFLADFTWLSTPWMLKAKALGKPFFPILIHAMIHAMLMSVVLYFFIGTDLKLWGSLVLFQWGSHFIIDVWKGRMNGWFPFLRDNTKQPYWIIFGFDQLLHATMIILMCHWAIGV